MLRKPFLFAFLSILFFSCKPSLDKIGQEFDARTGQKPVETEAGVQAVLNQLETVGFNKLDTAYVRRTKSEGDFAYMLKGKTFFKVKGEQMLLFLVDDIRLYEFMVKDDEFSALANHVKSRKPQEAAPETYLLMNAKLPRKLLQLMQELEKAGHDPHGFKINSCFRHPAKNLAVGGASRSRHIAGEAIDLQIGDINRDGKATQEDKSIVLDLLEHKVIAQTGGIGRYPGSMAVHFDVRGRGARWDSY